MFDSPVHQRWRFRLYNVRTRKKNDCRVNLLKYLYRRSYRPIVTEIKRTCLWFTFLQGYWESGIKRNNILLPLSLLLTAKCGIRGERHEKGIINIASKRFIQPVRIVIYKVFLFRYRQWKNRIPLQNAKQLNILLTYLIICLMTVFSHDSLINSLFKYVYVSFRIILIRYQSMLLTSVRQLTSLVNAYYVASKIYQVTSPHSYDPFVFIRIRGTTVHKKHSSKHKLTVVVKVTFKDVLGN